MTRRKILTDDQVRQIRQQHQHGHKGYGYRALSQKYGVAESTIRDIVTRRTRWSVI